MMIRREFLSNVAVMGAGACLSGLLPAWSRSGHANQISAVPQTGGSEFDLHVARETIVIDGRRGRAIAINGQVPAPLLRWREGEEVTLRVTNGLEEDTSIHWHGLLVPYYMDGVPGVSFPGIRPGETFTYRFPVRQAGTYWYHSHSGVQEQLGHYGPIIIDPAEPDPVAYDREYIIVLSDWTFQNPDRLFARLKKSSEFLNFQKRTLGDFLRDAAETGLGSTLQERAMWGRMRMSPTDIADVTGAAYTFLINGHGPADNWTGLFRPGERVRLRIINASAMTNFNVRIPELAMTVAQADGLNVRPVETDEFQIGVAETFDVVVRPVEDKAYTLMCETIDRSGFARATLAPRPGMSAPVPDLRPRPILTMKDMGMAGHDRIQADQTMDHAPAQHSAGNHGPSQAANAPAGNRHGEADRMQAHDHPDGPGVAGLARMPTNRLGEPGIGLEGLQHRVLVYSDLESLEPNPDRRPPGREIELHLTGNMERYMWSFDGIKFSEVDGPIVFEHGERLRLTMVNDTMMSHPIHLHGMFFDVVTGNHHHKPRKHTIVVKPGEKMSVDITADAPGDWAFHCHMLYHMKAGMMRVVSVREADRPIAQARRTADL